ncbi:hypothetical protein ACFL2B_02240 [Patescibacteria group bacterium]
MRKQHIYTLTLIVIILGLIGAALMTAPQGEAQDPSADEGHRYKAGISDTIKVEKNL